MPKKGSSAAATSSSNGSGPVKKARLDVNQVYNTTSDEEETAVPDSAADPAAFNELLLKEIEKAIVSREQYKKFDFNRISIEGHSGAELRTHYDRLRASAFRNIRHLPMKQEVAFVREHASSERPKRPRSAYLRYQEHERKKMLKRQPELAKDYKGLLQAIAEKWKTMSAEKKRPYIDDYEKDRKEFFREHPELEKKTQAPAKKATKTKTSGQGKKRLQSPKSAFDLFVEAKSEEYAEKYGLKGAELKQKLALKFQNLSDRKKNKWENRAKEAMEEYLQALAHTDRSHAATTTTSSAPIDLSDDPIQSPHDEDPILAKSPVDKPGKKAKKRASTSDATYENYIDLLARGEAASTSQSSTSAQGSAKKTKTLNSWLGLE